MQYKVPQNIDIEDKIVGPFTMKQFLYMMVGGFILYGWWNFSNTFSSPDPLVIFMILGLPVGLLTISLAMVKINDRPFEYFLLNMFRFLISPKQRKWIGGYAPEPVIKMDPLEVKEKKEVARTDSDLDSLAKSLDRQSAEIKAKAPQPKPSGAKPQAVNLSVKDVQSASQAQVASQANTPKKGLLGIFK